MKIDLLLTGLQALTAQSHAPGGKITLTRWALGDATDFTYVNTMTNAQGGIFATGDASKMIYVQQDSDKAMIICRLTPDDPTGVVGNLVLFCSFQGAEYPLLMMQQHVPVRDVKLQRTVHRVGTELNLNVSFSIPGLLNRFDFSNLTVEKPSWLNISTEFDLPAAFLEERDQVVVDNFGGTGKPALLFNAGNEFYGFGPLQFYQVRDGTHSNDPNTFIISGGASGDGYA